MIRPRPTTYIQARPWDGALYQSVDHLRDRVVAYCACGARLSRYRPLGDIACAPCQAKARAATTPDELHPPIRTAWDRQKPHRHKMCPQRGGPMHRHANKCRDCHLATLNGGSAS